MLFFKNDNEGVRLDLQILIIIDLNLDYCLFFNEIIIYVIYICSIFFLYKEEVYILFLKGCKIYIYIMF